MIVDILLIVAGLALLVVGGDFLVRGAVALALKLGIAPVIVGLTVLAFGTSAPPAFVSPFGRHTVGWPVRFVSARSPPPTYKSTFSMAFAISRISSARARCAVR